MKYHFFTGLFKWVLLVSIPVLLCGAITTNGWLVGTTAVGLTVIGIASSRECGRCRGRCGDWRCGSWLWQGHRW